MLEVTRGSPLCEKKRGCNDDVITHVFGSRDRARARLLYTHHNSIDMELPVDVVRLGHSGRGTPYPKEKTCVIQLCPFVDKHP